jgi:transposase-like protein
MGKHHDEAEMRAALARKDRLGLTYDELSEETGIPVSTLGYWRRKLRDEPKRLFEEIVVEGTDDAGARIEVIGPLGHRVLVGEGTDGELLRRVLEALPC